MSVENYKLSVAPAVVHIILRLNLLWGWDNAGVLVLVDNLCLFEILLLYLSEVKFHRSFLEYLSDKWYSIY